MFKKIRARREPIGKPVRASEQNRDNRINLNSAKDTALETRQKEPMKKRTKSYGCPRVRGKTKVATSLGGKVLHPEPKDPYIEQELTPKEKKICRMIESDRGKK